MHAPVMGIRTYFQSSQLAKMSDGTYCIIRDLGLVKGGKGLRHHETLLTLSVKGLASKLVEPFRHLAKRLDDDGVGEISQHRITASFESNSRDIGGVAKV
jgi:hypothetical protein